MYNNINDIIIDNNIITDELGNSIEIIDNDIYLSIMIMNEELNKDGKNVK